MDTKSILSDLRAERDKVDKAIAALEALEGTAAPAKPGRKPAAVADSKPTLKKRVMSASARKRIAEAQRKRWAEQKKAAVKKA